jgi:hypothetical protein
MHVKPRPGAQVLDPTTRRPIPEAGLEVAESAYWLRRLRTGDVTLVPAPAEVVLVTNPIPDSPEEQS